MEFDPVPRQHRLVAQLQEYTQQLIQKSRNVRDTFFWDKTIVHTPSEWEKQMDTFQVILWDKVIGRISPGQLPLHPHSRKIFDAPDWLGYEVTLDVLPLIKTLGYLLMSQRSEAR